MFGAFNGSKLIGIIGLISQKAKSFEIVQMYVQKTFSGSGVGRELLSSAKAHLHKTAYDSLFLTVYTNNKAALKSYSTSGFKPVTEKENQALMEFKNET